VRYWEQKLGNSLYYSLLAGKWGGEPFALDSIHRQKLHILLITGANTRAGVCLNSISSGLSAFSRQLLWYARFSYKAEIFYKALPENQPFGARLNQLG
jgi:hypothetical protein